MPGEPLLPFPSIYLNNPFFIRMASMHSPLEAERFIARRFDYDIVNTVRNAIQFEELCHVWDNEIRHAKKCKVIEESDEERDAREYAAWASRSRRAPRLRPI